MWDLSVTDKSTFGTFLGIDGNRRLPSRLPHYIRHGEGATEVTLSRSIPPCSFLLYRRPDRAPLPVGHSWKTDRVFRTTLTNGKIIRRVKPLSLHCV